MLTATSVGRRYGATRGLEPVSLSFGGDEKVAIVGPSGAGKSTLLHLLAALDRPTEGTVHFGGRDYAERDDEELAALRRTSFGFVFQSGRLVPYLSCEENVALTAMLAGSPRTAALERARDVLRRVGMDNAAKRSPTELSGGEAQRVAVARAVAHEPQVIFADEPTGNLDSEHSSGVMDLLLEHAVGRLLIVVTHDVEVADALPRRVEIVDGAFAAAAPVAAAP